MAERGSRLPGGTGAEVGVCNHYQMTVDGGMVRRLRRPLPGRRIIRCGCISSACMCGRSGRCCQIRRRGESVQPPGWSPRGSRRSTYSTPRRWRAVCGSRTIPGTCARSSCISSTGVGWCEIWGRNRTLRLPPEPTWCGRGWMVASPWVSIARRAETSRWLNARESGSSTYCCTPRPFEGAHVFRLP